MLHVSSWRKSHLLCSVDELCSISSCLVAVCWVDPVLLPETDWRNQIHGNHHLEILPLSDIVCNQPNLGYIHWTMTQFWVSLCPTEYWTPAVDSTPPAFEPLPTEYIYTCMVCFHNFIYRTKHEEICTYTLYDLIWFAIPGIIELNQYLIRWSLLYHRRCFCWWTRWVETSN